MPRRKKANTVTDYYPLTTCGDPPLPPSPPASAAPSTSARSSPPIRRSGRQPSKKFKLRSSAEGFPNKTYTRANQNERQNLAADDVAADDRVKEPEVTDVTLPNEERLKVLLRIREQLLSFVLHNERKI